MLAHFLPKFVINTASAEYFAFRGHGLSLLAEDRRCGVFGHVGLRVNARPIEDHLLFPQSTMYRKKS